VNPFVTSIRANACVACFASVQRSTFNPTKPALYTLIPVTRNARVPHCHACPRDIHCCPGTLCPLRVRLFPRNLAIFCAISSELFNGFVGSVGALSARDPSPVVAARDFKRGIFDGLFSSTANNIKEIKAEHDHHSK
jgi:hypothetical protein